MDGRGFSAAADRNKEPIFQVISPRLKAGDHILEIASGTGQHGEYMSERFRELQWQPSDVDPQCLESIGAWQKASGRDNFKTPLVLDCLNEALWDLPRKFNGIVNCNMIHISPWACCLGLFRQAKAALTDDGFLFMYGPYLQDDQQTAPSNLAFDQSLRARNPEWGIRRLEDVKKAAKAEGFSLHDLVSMPANNLSLVFLKD